MAWSARRKRTAVSGVLLVALAACSGSGARGVSAYCETVRAEQSRLGSKYETQADAISAESDPIVGLLGALAMTSGAQGDLAVYFDRLSGVAPSEIVPELEAIRDMFEEQASSVQDAVGDPLGALVGGMIGGFQIQGSLDRVNDYTLEQCGVSI